MRQKTKPGSQSEVQRSPEDKREGRWSHRWNTGRAQGRQHRLQNKSRKRRGQRPELDRTGPDAGQMWHIIFTRIPRKIDLNLTLILVIRSYFYLLKNQDAHVTKKEEKGVNKICEWKSKKDVNHLCYSSRVSVPVGQFLHTWILFLNTKASDLMTEKGMIKSHGV